MSHSDRDQDERESRAMDDRHPSIPSEVPKTRLQLEEEIVALRAKLQTVEDGHADIIFKAEIRHGEALREARAEGRAEGMEKAAKIVERLDDVRSLDCSCGWAFPGAIRAAAKEPTDAR